ncbi:MAG: NnrU family protein [Magnetovibrio sp.]|nr:NnrU family protein [Magnetovibrio sp.]
MSNLLFAIAVFIAFHMIPAIGSVRNRLIAMVGKPAYIASYSLLSIAILVWVSFAFVAADTDILWPQWPWTRWLPVLSMPLAALFLIGALSEPNPLSVGVKAEKFDSQNPGIVSITRHPLIWGLLFWSVAHIAPNGDTVAVLLFGLLSVLGLMGPISLDHKMRKSLGEEQWRRLSAPTSSIPFWAIIRGRTRLDLKGIGLWRIVLAAVVYMALLHGHELVIGVSPFPV